MRFNSADVENAATEFNQLADKHAYPSLKFDITDGFGSVVSAEDVKKRTVALMRIAVEAVFKFMDTKLPSAEKSNGDTRWDMLTTLRADRSEYNLLANAAGDVRGAWDESRFFKTYRLCNRFFAVFPDCGREDMAQYPVYTKFKAVVAMLGAIG